MQLNTAGSQQAEIIMDRTISNHAVRATMASPLVLTASYVAGTVFTMGDKNTLGIIIKYTKGDETSMQMKVEVSNDDGTTYGQEIAENVSGGTVTVSAAERSFSATGIHAFHIYPVRATHVKISVKATGGTPTGTCAITAHPSWA